MWDPSRGSPNRDFVLVDLAFRDEFRRQWSEIDRQWLGRFSAHDALGVLPALEAARDDLRAVVRRLAPQHPGGYLVPV